MTIKTAKKCENGIIINGVVILTDNQSGHVRKAYNDWLLKGNKPED